MKLLTKKQTNKEYNNKTPLEYLWKSNNTWHEFDYVMDSIIDLLKYNYKFRFKCVGTETNI